MDDTLYWRRRILDFVTAACILLVPTLVYFLIRIVIPWIIDQPVDGAPIVAFAFGVLSVFTVAGLTFYIYATLKKLYLQLEKEEEEFSNASLSGETEDSNSDRV